MNDYEQKYWLEHITHLLFKCIKNNFQVKLVNVKVKKVKVNIFLKRFLQIHLSDQNTLYIVGNLQVRLTYMELRLPQPYIYYSLAPQVHERTSNPQPKLVLIYR
jgi:hypothetical protein